MFVNERVTGQVPSAVIYGLLEKTELMGAGKSVIECSMGS